jgi:UDP-N-acetylglucosamine--N-acetylmuramyl-(pentapeptide) pyrophosphoryl-undecaprenol N-acetylglucosamine transferase
MTSDLPSAPKIAIACGGTGGHLFPGFAVAGKLLEKGSNVMLLVSPKQVDQQSLDQVTGAEIVTLPAVGLASGQVFAFLRGFYLSFHAAKRSFRERPPGAALAMGGFTSAPPILAAKRYGAHTFLHESNTIPGRANRWLSRIVDQAFVGFPSAAQRLRCRNSLVTGTPVRASIRPRDPAACRAGLGLDPLRPVVLVMGGSQGARAINELVVQCLPSLAGTNPDWQWLHLTGPSDCETTKAAYASLHVTANVCPFMSDMDLALGAATSAISRAGASSLAELAAMRLPAVLLPYPNATDNHQFFNAQAFEQTGAACLLPQRTATPEQLTQQLRRIMTDSSDRQKMVQALAQWDAPAAADHIATAILMAIGRDVQSANAGARAKIRGSSISNELNHCSSQRAGRRSQPSRFCAKPGGVAWA